MRMSNSGHMKLALLYLYLFTVRMCGNCLYIGLPIVGEWTRDAQWRVLLEYH